MGAENRVLHVAPSEKSLVRYFSERGQAIFGDLSPGRYGHTAIRKVDLMDISGLEPFGLLYASHVLEHVPDDRKVLSNVFQKLTSGGQAWILVPIHDADTVDGAGTESARDRERLFGQWDHVRQYGVDLSDRMRDAGFEVSIIDISDVSSADIQRHGLCDGDMIFVGTKP
jgi:hypothetical protein